MKKEAKPLSFSKELKEFYEKYSGNDLKQLSVEFEIEKKLLSKKVFGEDKTAQALFNEYEREEKYGTESKRNNKDVID